MTNQEWNNYRDARNPPRHQSKRDFTETTVAVCLAAMIVLAMIAAARADDSPPKYSVIKPEPAIIVEPAPKQAEPELKPEFDPVFSAPIVYYYVSADDLARPVAKWHCTACRQIWQAIQAGEIPRLRFELRAAPEWVTSTPTFHFQRDDGTWWNYPRDDEWDGARGFIKSYLKQCPKFSQSVQVGTPARSESTTADQTAELFRKFAGQSGRITFTPDTPIRAMMDDGTTIAYRSITGKYDYNDGHPTLTLDGDKPQMSARKFMMRFGLTLNDAQYDPPASATIGTSRGKYTIQLHKAD